MAKAKGIGLVDIILMIIIFVVAAVLILITIAFWVGLHDSSDRTTLQIVLYVVSAVLLYILAVVGIIGAIKRHEGCLYCFAACLVAMWIYMVIIVSLLYYAYRDCEDKGIEDSSLPDVFDNICEKGVEDKLIFIPYLVIMGVASCGCAAAYLLCLRHKDKAEGSSSTYYGK
eukprot:TRINITY_DN1731_c0_g1_i2.p1 TRINITY_DN1731_c0_g1~~TRINITY_DN1731_c0_g1_i2.p1  ORF type:complete len:171 (+),score=14.21 TRINITY_DN1731_c0_g1_i2:86-598(+)